MSRKSPHFFIQQCKLDASPEKVWKLLQSPLFYKRYLLPGFSIETLDSAKQLSKGARCHFKIKTSPLKGEWLAQVTEARPGYLLGFHIEYQIGEPWTVWIKCLPGETKDQCILEDRFEYPSGLLQGKVKKIEQILKRMVFYKNRTLKNDLEQIHHLNPQPKKVVIAGGTGLVGNHLQTMLGLWGYQVEVLSTKDGFGNLHWNPQSSELDPQILEGKDVIINLCGHSIACRWNKKNKPLLERSRIDSTRLLCETTSKLQNPPKLFIQASATGFYGYHNAQGVNESHPKGEGFLAELCEKWESETKSLNREQTQLNILRLGVVITPDGGALAKMLPIFRAGMGGKLGNGRQMMPWVSLNDLSYFIWNIIERPELQNEQIYNVCSPKIATNAQLTQYLARSLKKPAFFPVPSFILKILYGEMGKEALLGGIGATPEMANEKGFLFKDNRLEDYLDLLFGNNK